MSGLEAGDFGGTDRFFIQSRLGSGGYGVVYRAIDRERNRAVALKTLRHVAAKSLIRFKQEFRALADVSHPNLVTLYELSSHEDRWFFTMELVDGVNFLWYVRGETDGEESDPTSNLSRPTGTDSKAFFAEGQEPTPSPVVAPDGALYLDRLRPALGQLVEGVVALHDAGMLHRDIKPSNVLVTRDGRVVLLDFGLVEEIAPVHSHTVDAVGTPAYMSPEQVAGLPLTNASDWYNVGTMLYQALTGQLPFVGTPLDVMRRKQDSDPPPPRALWPDVPADLDAICEALLRRDPPRRLSGADLLRALRRRAASPPSPPAAVALPAGSPLFVGREAQLAALRDAFATVKAGRAITVGVHGSSGMGKSALVRRFLDELKASEPDAVVLAGRCYERESVPYKALDALVDALSRYLRHLPSAQAEAFLPHDILALARVFPVLRQVSAVNRARRAVLDIPDSLELRRRAFAALRELFVRLADRRPVVLFIDDLQWGDVDSAALLEDLMKPPDTPALMLIGCYRAEEAATSPLLKVILPKRAEVHAKLEMRDIPLGELSPAEADALARGLAAGHGDARHVTREAIVRESRGNPYFIEELVRFAHAEGSGSGSVIAAGGTRPDVITFDHVIETRVAGLPDTARRLLDVVAVAGAPVEVGVADRAADIEKEADNALALLRASHLVRTRMGVAGHEVEPYHDRIREAVVRHLGAEDLQACHLRLASALLSTGRGDPERLAMHYFGAADPESAAEYAATAAAKASEALAFDRAAGLYRFALNLRTSSPAERVRLEIGLGDALANAGRGAGAAEAYLSAAKGSELVLAIELHRRAAQQLYTSGHIEEGGRALRLVLAQVGMKLPRTHRMALVSLILRRAQVRLRGLRFRERNEAQITQRELLTIDTCFSVGVGLSTVDMVRGADFQARHLVLALRAGEPYRVAKALAMEVAYVAMGGSRSRTRARRLAQESQALAERVNRPYAVALATLTAGAAAWLDGRWRDGRTLCERAEQILRERCTGVDWEILVAQLFQLSSLFFLGEVAALSQRQPSLLEESEGHGNLLAATFLRVGFCSHVPWLAADRPDLALSEIDAGLSGWREGRFDYLTLWARGARTDIALYRDEPPEDTQRIGPKWRAMARSLDRFVQMGFIRGLDTRARRRLASAAHAKGAVERAAHLRAAEAHARAILKEKTQWGDPLALVLRAGVAAARGDTDAAIRMLESAEARFGAADMALHAAAARRRRGELVGGDAGGSLVTSADAWMAGQGIRRPDRMAAMLAPGRWRAS